MRSTAAILRVPYRHMDLQTLTKLLQEVATGEKDVASAIDRLKDLPFSDLGYARVDHHRSLRLGMPEIVFGERKSAQQIVGIVSSILEKGQDILVTRVDAAKAKEVQSIFPQLRYSDLGRTLSLALTERTPRFDRAVAIVTAGTSDIDVAEEAAETLLVFGETVERIYDVGVAGIHRLFDQMPVLERAPAIICVAGMEGALPSVLGGLVPCPVIAVPASVGYGAALSGFTALFSMLTGCASGVSVVNVDNGFGAAMAALRMTSLLKTSSE